MLIPPVAAGVLILAFLSLTGRWNNLDNPVVSQVALVAGILGAVLGMLVDRVSRWALVLVPLVLLILLLGFGDRLWPISQIDSETTSRGEIVTLLVIVVLLVGIIINIPQFARGRRRISS
jgi:hypothetical protein